MAFEISNPCQQMVISEIRQRYGDSGMDHDGMEDLACVALNHLPAKYYRHGVDLVHYLSPEERVANEVRVTAAVQAAFEFVERHRSR